MAAEFRYPVELPAWLLDGHQYEATPLTEDAEFEQGEERVRQIYTWAPQVANVSALFTQAHYDRWFTFFETELFAGTRQFDAPFESQTSRSTEWWTVQILEVPREQVVSADLTRVTARLLMLDGPFARPEAVPLLGRSQVVTVLTGRLDADLALRGRSMVTTVLTGRSGVPALAGRMDTATVLKAVADTPNLLLEDGGALLLEDGGKLLLEA